MKRRAFTKNALDVLSEKELQKGIHAHLMSGTFRCISNSGNAITILNPGKINPYEGPDFLDMAVLINGVLSIGKGEFHRKSSDWFSHGHHRDIRYANVLMHLVFRHDINCDIAKETVILNLQDIPFDVQVPKVNSLHSLDDLQDYALSRLLRKRDELQDLYHSVGDPMKLLELYGIIFLERRSTLRKRFRPDMDHPSIMHMFISSLGIQECLRGMPIPHDITKLNARIRGGISKHVYLELFVNCVAPFLLLFEIGDLQKFKSWYWSQPRFSFYHSLLHECSDIPQAFMWQQQGVLEWKKQQYQNGRTSSEIIYPYGESMIQEE
ncbi:MAG: DUF2851 family protein [Candidatus Kapaibacteriota bacterium]